MRASKLPNFAPWRTALALPLLALAGRTFVAAADEPPKVDEWWKRAKPVKSHGPTPWAVGLTFGYQDWRDLSEASPTDAQRAQGFAGAFDTTSAVFGIVGTLGAYRGHGLDVAVDLRLEKFRAATSELFVIPPSPEVEGPIVEDDTLNSLRLGFAARVTFRRTARVQPTVSGGFAVDRMNVTTSSSFLATGPGAGANTHSSIVFDLMVSGGLDIPLQKNVSAGLRVRAEAEVDHLGFTYVAFGTGNSSGPLALRLHLSFLFCHDEPTFWAH